MFQFGRFPAYTYVFSIRSLSIPLEGLPHSDICGSTLICSSPQLFAACRVLLRLPMPRHSPCALSSLNFMSFANRSNGFSCLLIVVFTLTLQYYLHCHVCTILDLLFLHFCFIQFSRYISQSLCFALVGSSGLEPPTSRLSGACSSLLSYEPVWCPRFVPLPWWR